VRSARRGLRAARLALAAAGLAALAPAHAQFAYDADVERFGAAIAAAPGHRDGVRKAMEFCGATFPDLGWNAYSAYGQWVHRHAAFLQLSIAMRRALAGAAEKAGTGERVRWERIAEVEVPKMANDLGAGLLDRVSSPASREDQRKACEETVARLHARKLDLDAVEPAIADYLRGMSGRFRIALPAAGEDPSLGPSGARRDAQALLGKWTTEKIRFYLGDGRFSDDDANCTLEFTGKTLTSDCLVSGRLVRVVSSYEVRAPGRYESTVVENALNPQMVGTRDVTQFRVENGKLVQSSYLPIYSADPMRPVEVEAVLGRSVLSGRRSE
jgi:hypothetical protein